MRITFETDTDIDSERDVTNPNVADEQSVEEWKYALATVILVSSIVVAPISNWLDSLVLVQQVRTFVNPQSVSNLRFNAPVTNSLASSPCH